LEPGVYILHERLKSFPPAQMVFIIYRRLIEHGILATYLWVTDKVLRRILGFSPPKISEVIPGLYVGGQQTMRGLQRMRNLGITAVINMREESDDTARGVSLDHYLWLPITDDAAPPLDALERGSRFIAEHLAAGRGVYVHCASGVGRAPTLAAAHLVDKGKTPAEAWSIVRKGRPFIRPTPPQIAVIETYARFRAQEQRTADG
jgi:protein-tyrosine phosphatase